jgi:hypothetical protein
LADPPKALIVARLNRTRERVEASQVGHVQRRVAQADLANQALILAALGFTLLVPVLVTLAALLPLGSADSLPAGIASRVGLSAESVKALQQLFPTREAVRGASTVIGTLFTLLSAYAWPTALQRGYELAWKVPSLGWRGLWRPLTWLTGFVAVGAVLIAVPPTHLLAEPWRTLLLVLLGAPLVFGWSWWSQHFLLRGAVSWRLLLPGAILMTIGLLGLRLAAALVLSDAITSNYRQYGPLGIVFMLISWLVAFSFVMLGGPLLGAARHEHRALAAAAGAAGTPDLSAAAAVLRGFQSVGLDVGLDVGVEVRSSPEGEEPAATARAGWAQVRRAPRPPAAEGVKPMRRIATGLLIIISAVSLLLASTSLWTRRNVVNTQVFVSNVDTMVDLPEVEARINQRVTDTVMSNPRVQSAIDDAIEILPPRLQTFGSTVEDGVRSLVSAGVQRLLTNDPFRPITNAALTSAHDQLVNGQPVRFTLGQAKDLVPDSARNGLAGQVLELLPDDVGVTILTPADAPQIYTAVDLLKSVWWWLGLLALGTLIGALAVSRRRRATLRAWAVTSTVLILLLLLTLRLTRGLILPQVKPENRDAVGAIYDVLAGSIRSWTLWLLAVVLVVLVLAIVWGRTGLVAGVRRGIASARASVQSRHEAKALAAGSAAAEDGGGVAGTEAPVEDEPWPRRVAAWTRAFADGLDLPERAARLGTTVRGHLKAARWAGIGIGVVVLLFWPAPTLSVLIWIAAFVALYLWALYWLQNQAPEPGVVPVGATQAGAGPAALAGAPLSGNGTPVTPAPLVPAPRPNPAADTAEPVATVESPLVPAALTPEAISTLSGRLDLLVRLGAAHDAGVLNDEEFHREKDRLLSV